MTLHESSNTIKEKENDFLSVLISKYNTRFLRDDEYQTMDVFKAFIKNHKKCDFTIVFLASINDCKRDEMEEIRIIIDNSNLSIKKICQIMVDIKELRNKYFMTAQITLKSDFDYMGRFLNK